MNATRKTKNTQLPDIKAVSFAPTEVKTSVAARPGRGHDTHRRLQWQSALFFSLWVLRGALRAEVASYVAARSRRNK